MSWDKDSLLAKAKIFFEKASQEDQDEIFFGLNCAMGLEVLSRAAIAKFSPTLLAEPDNTQQNLLYALNLGSAKSPKTISTVQVLNLCRVLVEGFSEEYFKIALAISNRRNEEVHTGTAAFIEYKTHQWIVGFYKCCKVLAEHLGETLETIFNEEEAKTALLMITETEIKTLEKIKSLIAAHTKVFEAKGEDEINRLKAEAEKQSEILSHNKCHKVTCPACSCTATVQGDVYGRENVEHCADEIISRQTVLPTKFSCIACGLKLTGYGQLSIAGVSEHFTHRSHYSPEDFYNMISVDDIEIFRENDEDGGYFYYSND